MTELIYTGQDGQEKQIPLLAKAGFTTNIIRLVPPSKSIANKLIEELAADMRRAKVTDLMPDDDYVFLMDVDKNERLGFIIQPQDEMNEEPKGSRIQQQSMLIFRSYREWLVVARGNTQITVNEQQIPLMKIVHHGMAIRLGELQLSFYDVTSQTIDAAMLKKIDKRKKCPFCLDSFLVGEQVIQCPSCNTLQHGECWKEYGDRCSGPPGCRYGIQQRHAFTVRE